MICLFGIQLLSDSTTQLHHKKVMLWVLKKLFYNRLLSTQPTKKFKTLQKKQNTLKMSYFSTVSLIVLAATTILVSTSDAAVAPVQKWTSSSLYCPTGAKGGTSLSCYFELTFPNSLDANLPEYSASNFEIVSDGCSHYADTACPSTATVPTRSTCTTNTCRYTFTWIPPPAGKGGNNFYVYALWKSGTDYVAAVSNILTQSGTMPKCSLSALVTTAVVVLFAAIIGIIM
eukprot:PhM_4_TR14812/c0_g1_i2/m.33742